jgi:hypothetical protein
MFDGDELQDAQKGTTATFLPEDHALKRVIYVNKVSWKRICEIAIERNISISELLVAPFSGTKDQMDRIEGKVDQLLGSGGSIIDKWLKEAAVPTKVEVLEVEDSGHPPRGYWFSKSFQNRSGK